MSTIAVLGPGAVGGTLAVRLAVAGREVVCIGTRTSVEAIGGNGLVVVAPDGACSSPRAAAERLERRVDILLVAVKAPALATALERVVAEPGVTIPLLNGLEHVEALRARFADVVAGSVSRFEAYREAPTRIRQRTPRLVLTLSREVDALRVPGIELRVVEDERRLLWDKAARLAPLAAATAASGLPVGQLRDDPAWRARLEAALGEAVAVAAAEGTAVDPAAEWAIIDAMAPDLTTSTARDVAAGRPSELDAVAGAVVRAGRKLGVPTPTLEELLAACRGS